MIATASGAFEVKPNGTEPPIVTANTNADPNSSSSSVVPGSAAATTSALSSTGTGTVTGPKNGAMGLNKGAAMAIAGSVVSVFVGFGLGLLA